MTSIVKKLRLEARLSQNQLARLADLDRATVSEVEKGSKTPQELTLSKLAGAFTQKLGKEITIEDLTNTTYN